MEEEKKKKKTGRGEGRTAVKHQREHEQLQHVREQIDKGTTYFFHFRLFTGDTHLKISS